MEFITFIAGIVWNFFKCLGLISRLELNDVLTGISLTVDNPFNDTVWNVSTGSFSEVTRTVVEWILDFINMPSMTVLESMLFVTLIIFVLGFFVRLISLMTVD